MLKGRRTSQHAFLSYRIRFSLYKMHNTAMTVDDAAVEPAMICGCCCQAEIDWLDFLAGVVLGWIVLIGAIWMWAGGRFSHLSRWNEEIEPLRSSFASIAETTSVSLDVSDTDKESLTGFDINVTNKVLGALKDHLQNIDTEHEIESLGKLHISYEPNRRAASQQLDLSSVLRRWSMPNENESASATSASAEMLKKRNSCCCGGSDLSSRSPTSKHSSRPSVTFEDGINPNCCEDDCPLKKFRDYHVDFDGKKVGEAKIEVVSEVEWFAEEADMVQAQEFDERVLSKISSLEESRMYLRRTRAVSLLSSRLMAAPDEKACYEIVSRLLVPLFHVDRISYVLMKDADNMLVKQITVNKQEHMIMGLDKGFLGGGRWEDEGYVKPLKGTAVEFCSKTLKSHYCPNIKYSPFETQRQISTMGVNTILATPILVNGNKFIGCIMICMVEVDAFNEFDRILIQDIAKKLGVNIYAKRMKHAAEMSSKISREMLHSMIPKCVIDKISCFWDESSDEYQRRRSSVNSSSISSGPKSRRSSLSRINSDESCSEKIHMLSKMYRQESETEDIGTLVESNGSNFPISATTKALYAENVDNVCIIFADIVGFSRISLELEPFVVVNMLQDLFARFDELCDLHRVQKLETIGDAFIVTAGIDGRSNSSECVREYAVRILNMAKDMVHQARHVLIPTPGGLGKNAKLFDSLEIRVGIHVGNVTCGVLGQRLPKMTVFGHAVNLAARMEQTSLPSHIRVTKDFHDLVAGVEDKWGACEEIEIKNMGSVDTYLLDPLKSLYLDS